MRDIYIDSIENIDTTSIIGSKYLSLNEDIFRDHFPNSPMLPAALMIQAGIQLSRIFVWHKTQFKYTVLPVSFIRFKFSGVIRPGNILTIICVFDIENTDYIKNKDIFKVKIVGSNNNRKIFQGTIELKVLKFDTLHDRPGCEKYLGYLINGEDTI